MLISLLTKQVDGLVVHGPILLLRHQRQRPFQVRIIERCILLDLYRIERDVLRFQPQGCLQGLAPLLLGLSRNSEHQIQVDVPKADPPCQPEFRLRFRRIVHPPKGLQQPVIKGLHPHGQPIDPGSQIALQFPGVQAVRIGLDGDLRFALQHKTFPHGAQDRFYCRRRQHRRRPAADEHRIYGVLFPVLFSLLHDLADEPLHIGGHGLPAAGALTCGVGMKSAVETALPAEGDVDVDSQFLHITCCHHTSAQP